jgi:hypothetical protein
MKRYALKGINDEQHECAVCGRIELKHVMWLVERDADGCEIGIPFHCGTTCGAKLIGYTQSKINTAVKKYAANLKMIRYELQCNHPSHLKALELQEQLRAMTLTPSEKRSHPLTSQIMSLINEAREWASAQEISVPL